LLEDEIHDLLGGPVGEAQVYASDDEEAEHHRSGLRDVAAIWPLHTLKLCPTRPQERNGAKTKGLARPATGSGLLGGHTLTERLLQLVGAPSTTAASTLCGRKLPLTRAFAVPLDLHLLLKRNAPGATHERGVELVDVPCVVERPREIRPYRTILRWGGHTLP
jgi:hypothetical protein